MKATGEAMAIDREFGAALLKAVRSLEPRGRGWLWEDPAWGLADAATCRLEAIPGADRHAPVADGRAAAPSAGAERRSWPPRPAIAPWFTERLAELVAAERGIVGASLDDAKRAGFGDAEIATHVGRAAGRHPPRPGARRHSSRLPSRRHLRR